MLAKGDLKSQYGLVPASDQDHSSTYLTSGSNISGICLTSQADPDIKDSGCQRMGVAASNQKSDVPYGGYDIGLPGDASKRRNMEMNPYTGLGVDTEPSSSIPSELSSFTQDNTTLEQSMVQEDLRHLRLTEEDDIFLDRTKKYTNSWLDST